jgi:hypothetical protein
MDTPVCEVPRVTGHGVMSVSQIFGTKQLGVGAMNETPVTPPCPVITTYTSSIIGPRVEILQSVPAISS